MKIVLLLGLAILGSLSVLPSSDAKTALIADFQSLESDSGIEWWEIPKGEDYTKILQDEKALDPVKLGDVARHSAGASAERGRLQVRQIVL
jgi:hypothetical protein